MELIKVEKIKQDEQVAILVKESAKIQKENETIQNKESQRQKQEKDVNEHVYSQLESMKVENAKLTKSIDDLKKENKAEKMKALTDYQAVSN